MQGYLFFMGRQNRNTKLFSMKKSPQSQKFHKMKGFEVGNMYLRACSLAHRSYTADYTRTTIVHHVTGEKMQLF